MLHTQNYSKTKIDGKGFRRIERISLLIANTSSSYFTKWRLLWWLQALQCKEMSSSLFVRRAGERLRTHCRFSIGVWQKLVGQDESQVFNSRFSHLRQYPSDHNTDQQWPHTTKATSGSETCLVKCQCFVHQPHPVPPGPRFDWHVLGRGISAACLAYWDILTLICISITNCHLAGFSLCTEVLYALVL